MAWGCSGVNLTTLLPTEASNQFGAKGQVRFHPFLLTISLIFLGLYPFSLTVSVTLSGFLTFLKHIGVIFGG